MVPREMLKRKEPKQVINFDKAVVEELSDKVYRLRMGKKGIDRMLAERGEKYVTKCAQGYAPITRCFLETLWNEGVTLPPNWFKDE